MSDPRYEGYGYGNYDPYQQGYPPEQVQQPYPPEQQQPQPQQYTPEQQYAQEQYDRQQYQYPQQPRPHAGDAYTQQWEGQTWDTRVQPSPVVDVTETAYLPPQGYGRPAPGYDVPSAQSGPGDFGGHAHPSPSSEPRSSIGDPGHPAGHLPMAGAAAEPESRPETDSSAGYGPATTTGNPRITDAQRARAEGRSPIIEPGIQPAALTAILGLLLAGTAAVGQYALLVPLILLQAVTAAGWFRLNGMWPARQGIALAFLGGVVADIALLAAGKGNAPAAILGTLGVWVLLVLVLQLRSRASADERMAGLMATVASSALAIIATGHLAASDDAVTLGGIAVAVAVIARALPLPTAASVVVALLAAAGAGIAVGGMTDFGGKGALLGLGAGVCALIGHRVASYDYPSRFVHMTAGVALPLAAAAPAVYLLGRAIG
ncbi:hypothetical protein GCM10010277_51370 [Streptomyces longisporoflavus]|uniref:hypothetical protein n=1 Tax=Streptomyces longisporoflavus TaxID=28044 RepID=UPI00167CBB00|nr:hypothetical protein GCM10010277_51370 [Streptomyces longisporoflavus]